MSSPLWPVYNHRMVYFGRVRDGRLELESSDGLREGDRVRVVPLQDDAASSEVDPVYRLGEDAVETGTPDLSIEHDHYAYGAPKRSTLTGPHAEDRRPADP